MRIDVEKVNGRQRAEGGGWEGAGRRQSAVRELFAARALCTEAVIRRGHKQAPAPFGVRADFFENLFLSLFGEFFRLVNELYVDEGVG